MPENFKNSFFNGILYYLYGYKLIFQRKYLKYVIIPIILSLIFTGLAIVAIVSVGFVLLSKTLGSTDIVQQLINLLPLQLTQVMPSIVIFFLIIFMLFFWTTIFINSNNLISAPFHSLLSEAIIGNNSNFNLINILMRELCKFIYLIKIGMILLLAFILLIFTIPILVIFAQVITLSVMVWYTAIQYIDYTADNQQIGFKDMLIRLKRIKATTLGFGTAIIIAINIPIINLFSLSAAVAGGALLWLESQDISK